MDRSLEALPRLERSEVFRWIKTRGRDLSDRSGAGAANEAPMLARNLPRLRKSKSVLSRASSSNGKGNPKR